MNHLSRRRILQLGLASGGVTLLAILLKDDRKPALEPSPIIKRADWGAREPNLDAFGEHGLFDAVTNPEGWFVYEQPLSIALNTIVIHHSALPLSDGPLEIQRLHIEQRGFADIAYHFLIDDTGQLYEGRSIGVRGAHTGGHNTGTVGICLLGNFENTLPTSMQIAALKMFIPGLIDLYAISHLAGHRDFQPAVTVCPGKHLAPLLPDLAAELGLTFGIGGYLGVPTPPA